MNQLNEDLRNRNFKKIYLLYGEESFLRKSYKRRFRESLVGDNEMNYQYFEGKGVALREVRETAETMPFFAEKRLIILEDTGLFQSAAEDWAAWVSTIPSTACVIFVETAVDKRTKFFKKVKETGYCAELGHQNPEQLKRWLMGIGRQNGMTVTFQAAESMIECCGEDMETLKNELDKVMAYCVDTKAVTPKEVYEICTQETENRIFDMIEGVSQGRSREVLEMYYDLVALREPSLRILFLLARQYNQLMQVRELMASGMSKERIAAKLKLRPFVAGKLMRYAKVFSFEQLKTWVGLCVDYEERIKTGQLGEQIAVEMLLVQLSEEGKRAR